MVILSLLSALGLAAVHFVAGKLQFLKGIPRSRWLSLAGGASVAYVFLHLLPTLSRNQDVVAANLGAALSFLESHIYVIALAGLTIFYGLQRLATRSQAERAADKPSTAVFWIHILSFAVFNGIVGYLLLHLERPTTQALLFFALAMGLHFLVTDYGLEEQHQENYTRVGRWLVAAAVLLGWVIGYLTNVSEFVIAVLIAFLGGGVILNVLKEELPKERESRFSAFVLGVVVYTALLFAA